MIYKRTVYILLAVLLTCALIESKRCKCKKGLHKHKGVKESYRHKRSLEKATFNLTDNKNKGQINDTENTIIAKTGHVAEFTVIANKTVEILEKDNKNNRILFKPVDISMEHFQKEEKQKDNFNLPNIDKDIKYFYPNHQYEQETNSNKQSLVNQTVDNLPQMYMGAYMSPKDKDVEQFYLPTKQFTNLPKNRIVFSFQPPGFPDKTEFNNFDQKFNQKNLLSNMSKNKLNKKKILHAFGKNHVDIMSTILRNVKNEAKSLKKKLDTAYGNLNMMSLRLDEKASLLSNHQINLDKMYDQLFKTFKQFISKQDSIDSKINQFATDRESLLETREKISKLDRDVAYRQDFFLKMQSDFKKKQKDFADMQKVFAEKREEFLRMNSLLTDKNEKIMNQQKDINRKQLNIARTLLMVSRNTNNTNIPNITYVMSELDSLDKKGIDDVTQKPKELENEKIHITVSVPKTSDSQFGGHIQSIKPKTEEMMIRDHKTSDIDDLIYKYYFHNTALANIFQKLLRHGDRKSKVLRNSTEIVENKVLPPTTPQQTKIDAKLDNISGIKKVRQRRWVNMKPIIYNRKWRKHGTNTEPSFTEILKAIPLSTEAILVESTTTIKPNMIIENTIQNRHFLTIAEKYCNEISQNSNEDSFKHCVEKTIKHLKKIDQSMQVQRVNENNSTSNSTVPKENSGSNTKEFIPYEDKNTRNTNEIILKRDQLSHDALKSADQINNNPGKVELANMMYEADEGADFISDNLLDLNEDLLTNTEGTVFWEDEEQDNEIVKGNQIEGASDQLPGDSTESREMRLMRNQIALRTRLLPRRTWWRG